MSEPAAGLDPTPSLSRRLACLVYEGLLLFGLSLLPGALARLSCERYEVVEGGDHSILIGRVLEAQVAEGEPLAWWQGGYRRLADLG